MSYLYRKEAYLEKLDDECKIRDILDKLPKLICIMFLRSLAF